MRFCGTTFSAHVSDGWVDEAQCLKGMDEEVQRRAPTTRDCHSVRGVRITRETHGTYLNRIHEDLKIRLQGEEAALQGEPAEQARQRYMLRVRRDRDCGRCVPTCLRSHLMQEGWGQTGPPGGRGGGAHSAPTPLRSRPGSCSGA